MITEEWPYNLAVRLWVGSEDLFEASPAGLERLFTREGWVLISGEAAALAGVYREKKAMGDVAEDLRASPDGLAGLLSSAFEKLRSDRGRQALRSLICPDILEARIEKTELSTRTSNALRSAGLETVWDLTRITAKDLARIRGIGRNGASEVEDLLDRYGLSMRKEGND